MFVLTMLALITTLLIAAHAGVAAGSVGDRLGEQDSHWKAELCCQLHLNELGGKSTETGTGAAHNLSLAVSSLYQCHVRNATNSLEDSTNPESVSGTTSLRDGDCLDIRCWLEDKHANVVCYLKHHAAAAASSSRLSVGLRTKPDPQTGGSNHSAGVRCDGTDEVSCSTSLHPDDVAVSLSVSGFLRERPLLAPDIHIGTDRLWTPSPPFDLRYNVTAEGEVLITWRDSQTDGPPGYCQIRYSANTSVDRWEVLKVLNDWVSLNDLTSGVGYTVQVRCLHSLHSQHSQHSNYWSDWSDPLDLTLDVSYIPAEVFTEPGAVVTVYGVFHNHSWSASKAVWMLNGHLIPGSRYSVINERVSAVTLSIKEPGFDTLMCCYPWGERYKCSIAYAKVYTVGFFDANITCQVAQTLREDTMTCKWNKSAWAVVRLLYRSYRRMCEEIPHDEASGPDRTGVEECPDGAGDYRECTLRGLNLLSCYKLWLVVEGGHNKVISRPVFMLPFDYVKPAPLSDLSAVSWPNRTLTVAWKRPYLPVYDLQYELRYVTVRGMDGVEWKLYGPIHQSRTAVQVGDLCVQYKVQVRCRRNSSSGYWSDWSEAHVSTVNTTKAPEAGPDFWRVIQEHPGKNSANVTLLFKNISAVDPTRCVLNLVVVHQSSGGAVWSHKIVVGSNHSFQWRGDVHTVTVMSLNSLGLSVQNRNMTLVPRPKKQCIRWLHAASNGSCVSLSWSLTGEQPLLRSFVVEWLELSADDGQKTERVEWLRVPAKSRELHLCRHFYGTEEFILYPVFQGEEGEPLRCTAVRSDVTAYMLLMIIAFLSVVLFVTLIISQNQLRKLMWKDVPNPNNCSWAKGMDFRKMDGADTLFAHPEGLTACPLLPVSERVCEVEIVDKLFPRDEEPADEALLCHSVEMKRPCAELASIGGSLEPLSLDASAAAVTPETSGQSSVTYSTVLVFDRPVLVRKAQESLSSSSDEGNFSANTSDISGSFPGNLWELENPPCSDAPHQRNSGSYNSAEDFSEASEQEDEASVTKELYYMGMNDGKQEEQEEEEEEGRHPNSDEDAERDTGKTDPETDRKDPAARTAALYLPQFRTVTNNALGETVG